MALSPREKANASEQQRLFVPAGELRSSLPGADVRETCEMCDGREPAMSIGSRCLEASIETVIERMISEGRLDDQLQKVLDRRMARGSIPTAGPEDHELVDEVSGIIMDP